MKPTIGRIVHYITKNTDRYYPVTNAAIITNALYFSTPDMNEVDVAREDSYSVSLAVFPDGGVLHKSSVPFSREYKVGHWSWPPREEKSVLC